MSYKPSQIHSVLAVASPGRQRLWWSRGNVLAFRTQVAGSNPAEAVGFFRAKTFSARFPSEEK
jgi:hypothetical protein